MIDIIGSWAPLLGEEFTKEYMLDVYKKFKLRTTDILQTCEPSKDRGEDGVFAPFLKTPFDEVKVLIIVEGPGIEQSILEDIEEEMCDGLNLNLVVNGSYDHLMKQGIMFLPRHLTKGDRETHREWRVFTDEVILKLVNEKNILVVSSREQIQYMLYSLRPFTTYISEYKPWKYIDQWVKDNYGVNIKWSPDEQE